MKDVKETLSNRIVDLIVESHEERIESCPLRNQECVYEKWNLMRRELKESCSTASTPSSSMNLMRRELKASAVKSVGSKAVDGESHEERIESEL